MRISTEGYIGAALGLLGLLGAGALVVASPPWNDVIGWLLITIAIIGGLFLVVHHFWQKGWRPVPYHLIVVGIAGATLFGLVAAAGLIWNHYWSPDVPTQVGAPPTSRPSTPGALGENTPRRRNSATEAPAVGTGLTPTVSNSQPFQPRYYSDAEKQRVGNMLYDLSTVCTDYGDEISKTIGQFFQNWNPQNFDPQRLKHLADLLQAVNDISVKMNKALFDAGGVKETYRAYSPEINFIIQGDSRTLIAPLQIARNRVADGIRTMQTAAQDKSPLSGGIGYLMAMPVENFGQVAAQFQAWLNGCNQRIDVVRRSLD